MYRQGDILFKKVKQLPKGAKGIKTRVVAHGENGHRHEFKDDTATLFMLNDKMFAELSAPTTLYHEEHVPFEIGEGVYEIVNEREYDYAGEEIKKVVD